MTVVAIVGRVRADGLARLRERPGTELLVLEEPSEAELLAAMPGVDAILVRTARITRAMIEAAPSLRIVSRHGVGYDNVDLQALNERRIPLTVSASANMVSVAEHALYMMLELMKHGRRFDAALHRGDWAARNRFQPHDLFGKTLLLVGFGRIGQHVAARARAFEMEVLVVDPLRPREVIEAAGGIRLEDLHEALARADAVSLHCPLHAATRHLIDARALAAMKPDAILVNTARGGLVDEAALAEALRSGRLAGAGIDAFADEPPPADHPLMGLDNVLLTPHMAGVTAEAALRMAVESAENVVAALDGRLDPAVVVNPEVL